MAAGSVVVLDASSSTDANGDPLTYHWTLTSKPVGCTSTLSGESTVHPTFTACHPGTYELSLVVSDGKTESPPAKVTVVSVIGNAPPTANAGPDQNVSTGSLVTLDGSGSTDADGNLFTYRWAFTSRPAGSASALSSATAVRPTFTADVAGTYVLSLFVNDGTVDGAPDTVAVVAATGNSTPLANAGPDQNVSTGSLVTLDGSGSTDADGNMVTYRWAFTSRPAGSAARLSDATAVRPTFTADVDGTYALSLLVNDGVVDSAPDTVTVVAATGNSAPMANAGPDQTVVTGAPTTLDGSGSSDADGDALTYSWSFVSKPAGSIATLTASAGMMPTFVPDRLGSYVLALSVNDGRTSSLSDQCVVTVVDACPDVRFEGNINRVVDSLGEIKLLGEVKNYGAKPASFSKITCTLRDAAGFVLNKPYTYAYGSCMTLAASSIQTDTILKPGEVGAYEMYTDITSAPGITHECTLTFDDFAVSEPLAKLLVSGEITRGSSFLGTELSGTLTNVGSSDLIFGKIWFALKDAAGSVIDTHFTYVDGVRVWLSSISTFTDTGLYSNGVGTFSTTALAPFPSVASMYYKTSWDDATIDGGIVFRTAVLTTTEVPPSEKQLLRERDGHAQRIRESLIHR